LSPSHPRLLFSCLQHKSNTPLLQIAESFRRFGVTSKTTSLLAIKVLPASASTEIVATHLQDSVRGKPLPFTDETIAQHSDMALIRKIYKLSSSNTIRGAASSSSVNGTRSKEKEIKEAEAVVLGMMAIKGS
jgi:EKC/KEOPS complex subunit CGI121/TPRKB